MEQPFIDTTRTYRQGSTTLSRESYASPQVFDDELERIFRRHWVCVGSEAEIPAAGDYLLASVADESLIVVRGDDGRVRAFYNVCRHRGTRLCAQESGALPGAIQCPYHGWTYELDGRLRAAPHMEGVDGFDRGDHPLRSVALDRWEGFLFVSLAAEPQPLVEWLAPLADRFSRFRIAELRAAERIVYDVRANWKLLFENYSECQHCPLIHPELSRRTPYKSASNDLVEGPFLGGPMEIADGTSMTLSGNSCGVPVGELSGADLRRVYYYSIFPNMFLSLHPDFVMVHRLQPRSEAETRIVCEWLFHPDSLDSDEADPQDAVRFWDLTNRQDWQICEQAQLGVSSRSYTPGPYSVREGLPAAWDREYLRRMAG